MTMIGWSPSQEESIIKAKQQPRAEVSFINNEALNDLLARSLDTPERQVALGYLFTANKQLKELMEYADSNEVVGILDELDVLAVVGQTERAKLQRMELEITSIRANNADLENAFNKASRDLANVRASRPGQFSTRKDIARWDAEVSAAEAIYKEAEDAIRGYGYALPSHLQNVEAQKVKLNELMARDKALRSRLARLTGAEVVEQSSAFHTSDNGLGGSR